MKQKTKRGWSRKRLLGLVLLCLVPLGLAAILVGVGLWWQSSEIAAIRAEQDRVRGELEVAGVPVTWDQWKARQPVFAEEDNGAPFIAEAVRLRQEHTGVQDALLPYVGHLETPEPYEAYSEESLGAMAAYVGANQAAINAFLQAVSQSYIDISSLVPDGVEDEDDWQNKFHIDILRLRETLGVAVDLAIAADDSAAQWRLLEGYAKAVNVYPDFASYSRCGALIYACDAIERALNQRAFTDSELEDLGSMFDHADPTTWYRTSLVHDTDPENFLEPRMYLVLNPVWTFAAQSPLPDSAMARIAGRDYEDFKLRILENALDAVHLCEGTWGEARPVLEERQAWADAEDNGLTEMYEMGPFQHLQVIYKTRAQLVITRIALALESHLANHGALPTTLAALVESKPDLNMTDPFDGEPIRYVVKETGYLLYSVGENLADDGGVTYRKRGEQEHSGDIVFEVRR